MKTNDNFEFVVIKKTFTFATCTSCDGTGNKSRSFRKMTFVEDCPDCHGEGRRHFSASCEVPLREALKELQLEEVKPVVVNFNELSTKNIKKKNQSIV